MRHVIRTLLSAALLLTPFCCPAAATAKVPQTASTQRAEAEAERYPSPDVAAQSLIEAVRSDDPRQLAKVFGSRHPELLSSGDEVDDKNNRAAFLKMAEEKMRVERTGEEKAVLHLGQSDWPFPVPLVKSGGGWFFDAEQGLQEVLNRRIGRNELSTLSVMNGYVEAQFEYASVDRDGDGVVEYAQKLYSDPGTRNGLFWETSPGEQPSPMGPLVAQARAEGYKKGEADKPVPYHGYYYKILTRQGDHVPGGKYNYIINGNMIAGFALVAYPAEYGSSGIMTFVVNHQGKIYQKDLGPKTAQIAAAMNEYNPDSTWAPAETEQPELPAKHDG